MNEDIIRIALEAGFKVGPSRDGPDDVWGVSSNLVHFADLIRADEREACAKLCEEQYEYYGYDHVFAEIIRARGTP
jgi:hypothetical protein